MFGDDKLAKAGELCDEEIHPEGCMCEPCNTHNDNTPIAYGVELDSVVAVANAFAHLDEPYNAGDIAVRSSEDLVIIQSRGTHFGHMDALLKAQKQGHISIQSINAGTNRDGDSCLTIEVVGGNE